jgi:hypothetical protein
MNVPAYLYKRNVRMVNSKLKRFGYLQRMVRNQMDRLGGWNGTARMGGSDLSFSTHLNLSDISHIRKEKPKYIWKTSF